jgi:hypothetical protein
MGLTMLVDSKTCSTCKQSKKRRDYHRSSTVWDGLDPRCRDCRKNAGTNHIIDMGARQSGQRLRIYGLTPSDYQRMYQSQRGLCAICKQPETMTYRGQVKQLSVDHNHATGEVRGLLCAACNFAIGKFNDNPTLLRAAANYLERDARTVTRLPNVS